MTPRTHRRLIVASFLYAASLLAIPSPAHAEDIDIFSINPNVASQRPNVLIILDTSSNWARTDSVANDGSKVFHNVRSALGSAVGALTDQFNVGLMMFAETGGGSTVNDNIDGGVIRAGVRWMSSANRTALVNFFNSVDGTYDQSNQTTFGLAFYEAYLYFTGQTGYAGIGKIKRDYPHTMSAPCTGPQNANSNCTLNESNVIWNLPASGGLPANALTNVSSTQYNKPITDACQKNFIIFISNGPNADAATNATATTRLAAAGGNTTTITFTEDTGDQGNISDEWARFLANTDLLPDASNPSFPGKQTIVSYAVEVNPKVDQQGRAATQLMKSVATQGKGKYFGVTSAGGGAAIADALNKIFAEILSVNSVFAASTLPVSVNVRGTFLNQVYMGVFRPDANSSPRWPGNVKQYALAASSSGSVFLVDKNGQAIENATTGFVSPTAVSYWTRSSTFWDNAYYPETVAQPPQTPTTSDVPDGEFVEKGGAAQHLRSAYATDVTTRKLYTCLSAAGCASDSVLSSDDSKFAFATGNSFITDQLLGISNILDVTSLTRSGSTVTATVPAHPFTNGQVVEIRGANQQDYNVTTNITVPVGDPNTFTYTITERPVSPAVAASGQTMRASRGVAPLTIQSLSANISTGLATATFSAAHGFSDKQLITISGAVQDEYNRSVNITTGGPTSTTFTYPITVGPATPANPVGGMTGTKNGSTAIASTNASITRSGNTVTVVTNNDIFGGNDTCTTVSITGANPSVYNVTNRACTRASGGDNKKSFTFTLTSAELTPVSPATTTSSLKADPALIRDIASMSRLTGSGQVLVTTNDVHGFSTGNTIQISGASDSLYNGSFNIDNADPTTKTFTYNITPQPVSPATGSIKAVGGGGVTRDDLIRWVRGRNVKNDDNPSGVTTTVRGYLHGDVLHSRPAVVNYNRSGQPADRDLVVYYGANDGIVHAVKGGQNDADGDEKWGFIPSEFYTRFARLYLQSPIISSSVPRAYFADGPISVDAVYVTDTSVTPNQERLQGAGARAQLYIGMRRGGRFYYSLDVTNPDLPTYKWKIDNATPGFAELGQSWSEAKVVKMKLTTCPGGADAQGICKVLVFGAGYDPVANDPATQGTATMGRGIFVVDAKTGALIWHASPNVSPSMPSGAVHKYVSGMTYAIPADLAVINSDLDFDNIADRIYAADTGGNIWRVNISDPSPSLWGVGKIAELAGTGVHARKFLFAPDSVAYDSTTDSVLIGSGDREHPFDTTIQNRYYMIKDSHGMNDLPATPAREGDLVDLTTNTLQDPSATQADRDAITSALASSRGWMIRLTRSGEKTVTGATTLGGTTIFATNTPVQSQASGQCTGSLGTALIYAVDFRNATARIDFDLSGSVTQGERATERPGGGFPPTAIPFATQIGSQFFEGAITGTQVVQPTGAQPGWRYRVFWNLSADN